MRMIKSWILCLQALFITAMLMGCQAAPSRNYEEVPGMLDSLTGKAQVALEQGCFSGGEQAALDCIRQMNANVLNWFPEHNYEVRLGIVGNYAVVMVCDIGKPVFEDTNCNSGPPDKDHRNKSKTVGGCKITMTLEEVQTFCK